MTTRAEYDAARHASERAHGDSAGRLRFVERVRVGSAEWEITALTLGLPYSPPTLHLSSPMHHAPAVPDIPGVVLVRMGEVKLALEAWWGERGEWPVAT